MGRKNRRNQAKHSLSFEVAIRAFDDPVALFEFNSAVDDEDRRQVMGKYRRQRAGCSCCIHDQGSANGWPGNLPNHFSEKS
jgi:uncharacterized DUF497 family protein